VDEGEVVVRSYFIQWAIGLRKGSEANGASRSTFIIMYFFPGAAPGNAIVGAEAAAARVRCWPCSLTFSVPNETSRRAGSEARTAFIAALSAILGIDALRKIFWAWFG